VGFKLGRTPWNRSRSILLTKRVKNRFRGYCILLIARDNDSIICLDHEVRRHDLHAKLIEDLLNCRIQVGNCFDTLQLVFQPRDQCVLDVKVRELFLATNGLGDLRMFGVRSTASSNRACTCPHGASSPMVTMELRVMGSYCELFPFALTASQARTFFRLASNSRS